jgi:hypothetical protein
MEPKSPIVICPIEKCILPHVRIARKRHRYPSNQQREDQSIAKNVYQNIEPKDDFKLKYA